MRCPQCHADNPEQASVCLACGAALTLTCPQCGTELPPQANFCFHCGHPATAPAAEPNADTVALLQRAVQRLAPQVYTERLLATRGQVARERRIVTMLFCDVQASTFLAETLDPEEMMDVMDGAFDVLIPPIYRYEGTVARLMGDAVLAFFGAPIAHEDDPACACRAALQIISEAQEYARKLEHERGLAGFNVRVGIHTGPVVVGEVGTDLRVEYTAMGDAINLAQRLQSTAAPGTVWISGDTQRLIVPWFETEALGEMVLRGKAQPVSVYRVVAAKEVPHKPRGIAGLDSPLVGREAEMAALQGAVERLQGGQGGIVTIVGEAGIGKSRLVAESRALCEAEARKGLLSPRCHPEGTEGSSSREEEKVLRFAQNDKGGGVQWVEGRCLSYGGSIAYQLWTDVLRHLLDIPAAASPQEAEQVLRQRVESLCPQRVDQVYPYLARILSLPLDEDTENRLAELNGEQVRSATFEAVQTLVECTARQGPLVLVCEDIYWSDPTSMELLEQLLPLTEKVPLLLICIFRPRKEHPSWRVREVAARDYAQRHTDLWLSPLSQGHSGELLSNLLAMSAVPETLEQRILERAEGNPFYVEEIIRALIAQGALDQDEGGQWMVTRDVAEIAIPDTLNGVLTARIDQLPDADRHVLQMASVIGRLFTYPVLAAIARLDGELEPHLMALQEAELIRERARQPERQYIFKHELTREAAYNGLLKRERRVLHREVAEAVERLFPERVDEQLGLLAHHWERAGDADKAIDYSLRAGDQARLIYAHQEAVAYYQRALVLAEAHDNLQWAARTWMKLGLAYHGAFDFPRARQAYDQGFALWQQAASLPPATLPPPAPHALRMDWFPAPPGLAPPGAYVYAYGVLHALFGRLVEHTVEMDVVPDMARDWEVSEGGKRYTFHLRDDARWSDATLLTAADFECACKRTLDPARNYAWAVGLYDIRGARAFHQGETSDASSVGVRAVDDVTLVVELEHPTSYFLHLADFLYPIPRHVVEIHGDDWVEPGKMVTCGPFLVEAWQPGKSLSLVRNPEYVGRFSGNLQRIVLDMTPDPFHHLQLYEEDALDVFFPEHLPHGDMYRAAQRHGSEDLSLPKAISTYLGFDVSRPPFDDVRVRRAFGLATDRTTLSGAGACAYFPASGGLIPPTTPGHSAGIALPFDPVQARQLLAEAGYPGGRGFPTVTFSYVVGGEDQCRDLQAQWREHLGVDVAWDTVDLDTYLMRLFSDPPQLYSIATLALYGDPDWPMRCCPFRQFTKWRHERYDELVEQARRATDQDKRMAIYRQAEDILVEEAPILVLMYGLSMLLVKPWVKRFPLLPTQRIPLWKDIILEPH